MKVSRKKGWRSFRSRTNCSLMSDVLIIEVLSGLNAETGFFLKNSECFQPKLHLGRWSATLAHWWLLLIPTDIKKCLKRDSLSHLSLSLSRTRPSDKMQPYPWVACGGFQTKRRTIYPLSLDSPAADNMHLINYFHISCLKSSMHQGK